MVITAIVRKLKNCDLNDERLFFSSSQPMASTLNISRSSVLEPLRKEWIPYQTVSDALVANLHLTHNVDVALSVIDLFLDLLRNPSFDPSQISFSNSSDIDARVSEHRGAHIRRPCHASPSADRTAGIPHTVLELVAEHMFAFARVLTPKRWVLRTMIDEGAPYSLRDVACLSLVHRTWVPTTPKLSRRRAYVGGNGALQSYLRDAARTVDSRDRQLLPRKTYTRGVQGQYIDDKRWP